MTKFKDVAHLYLGCEVKSPFMGKNQKLCGVSKILMPEGHYELDPVIEFNCNGRYEVRPTIWGGVKPLLRPLDSMTEEEVLTICKLACESVYGDYRFSKWSVERSPHELCHWDVNNKRSLYSFTVSSIDGDVLLYDGEDIDPVYIDSNYRFWYLKQGFDLFSLIPNGEAIDKTKI